MDYEPPMIDCDFDHDGFGGFSGDLFMKWNDVRYSLAQAKEKSPAERNAVIVDPANLFASDLRAPPSTRQYTIIERSTPA